MNYGMCLASLDGNYTDRLFNSRSLIRGYTLDELGNAVEASNWAITDYIDITGITNVIIACNLDTVTNAFYNENKQFIGSFESTAWNNPISVSGKYMRLTSQINRIGKMKIFTEVGDA